MFHARIATVALAAAAITLPSLAQLAPSTPADRQAPRQADRPNSPRPATNRLIPQVQGPLTFDKMNHDFGAVASQDAHSVAFSFENTSDKPVTIARINASCGCTTTALEQKTYAPGEKGRIEAAIKPGRDGSRSSVVTVSYQDPSIPPTRLRLSVTYNAPNRVATPVVNFGLLAPTQTGEQILTVQSKDQNATIQNINAVRNAVIAEVLEDAGELLDPNYPKQFRVRLTTAPDVRPGPVRDALQITISSSSGTDIIPVRVTGIIQQDLGAQPQFANLKDDDGDGTYTGRFRLFSRANRDFNVTDTQVLMGPQGTFEATVVKETPANGVTEQWIELSGTPTISAGVFRGTVRITTDVDTQPLDIMFTGLVRTPAASN